MPLPEAEAEAEADATVQEVTVAQGGLTEFLLPAVLQEETLLRAVHKMEQWESAILPMEAEAEAEAEDM